MSSDVATAYAFGRSTNFVSSENPDFEENFRRPILLITFLGIYLKQFTWLHPIFNMIPTYVKYQNCGSLQSFMLSKIFHTGQLRVCLTRTLEVLRLFGM